MTVIAVSPALLAHAVTAALVPVREYSDLPVSDMQVGDLYRHIPEKGTARVGEVVSIEPAGRYDRTQVIVGVKGLAKNAKGDDTVKFFRHEVIGTFNGQFKITGPEAEPCPICGDYDCAEGR